MEKMTIETIAKLAPAKPEKPVRTRNLVVRLTPDIGSSLDSVASAVGMSLSAMASMLIEAGLEQAVERMAEREDLLRVDPETGERKIRGLLAPSEVRSMGYTGWIGDKNNDGSHGTWLFPNEQEMATEADKAAWDELKASKGYQNSLQEEA